MAAHVSRVFRKMSYFVANFDFGDQTAKQIDIQFADRPTCYEIHTHFAVKLTVAWTIGGALVCCNGVRRVSAVLRVLRPPFYHKTLLIGMHFC